MPYLTHHLEVVYVKKEEHHLGHEIPLLIQGQDQLLQHPRDQLLLLHLYHLQHYKN